MDNSTGNSPRCDHRSGTLGCARGKGHDGSHWLTGNPEAARRDLLRQGIGR